MTAIIEIKGKQFKVAPQQTIYVDLMDKEEGSEFEIKNVLLVEENSQVQVGQPYVSSAVVKAKVLEEVKGPKVVGFKYKRKKGYRKSWGHRQRYQKLQIVSILA